MLHVHRSHRADALADVLGDVFAAVPADPFTPEVVAVPTRGVERWLTQTLSLRLGAQPGRSDGVVANVRFPSPREIVDDAVAAACGVDPAADPWRGERVVWPLLEVVDDSLDEDWLALLAQHLRDVAPEDDDPAARRPRLAAVRHIAALFDRYALHRPEMVRAWALGSDVDGAGAPLRDDAVWQAWLWRALRARIGTESAAERLPGALARVRAEPLLLDLPARLAAFGLTRLPRAHLELLRALAEHRDVHLLVLHPSPVLWDRVAAAPAPASRLRADDPAVALPQNRLLASWGRDVRELQLVLGENARQETGAERPEPAADSLLGRLQADVFHDRAPGSAGEVDDTVQIHACHGRARQVEVLRDTILHALANDHTLEPRDVVVMCPDIETFAPLIRATFGATAPGEAPAPGLPPDLHVRLADRSLRQTNPILGTISRLLELADGRMTASDLLDLADRPPVRRRFQIDDDDLSRIEGWTRDAEIRWGLDAENRARFKLDKVEANTWAAGVDRLLLGIAMTDDPGHLVGGVLPVDDVGSGDIELAGKLAEFVDRVRTIVTTFEQPRPLDAWAVELERAADLLCDTTERDAWQRGELGRILARVIEGGGETRPLALAEVRGLLADRLAGRPTSANFRTGHLTFCTLHPMRSVPHRVIALLGLDDGAFPRAAPRDGDDLVLAQPFIGDHDGRTEDRQLLLDALMAAQDRLIITYTGNDERTNAPLPPAVPVSELLDVIGTDIVQRHPLQPFDPRNFRADAPLSFDGIALEGARALTGPRVAPAPFLPEPLPPLHTDVIEVEELVRFLQAPAKELLRRRLDVRFFEVEDDLDDDLPVELDGLEKWKVGDRLVSAVLAGHTMDAAIEAERARGGLPPGKLAERAVDEVRGTAQRIVDAANANLSARKERGAVDVRVELADGRLISGTVNGVAGDRLELVTYSNVAAKHRLAAWVRLLALTAAYPGRPFTAVTLGRAGRGKVLLAKLRTPTDAQAQLERLVALMDIGLTEPVPLACKTSEAYASAIRRGAKNVAQVTEKAWDGTWNFPGEAFDLEHQRVFGGVLSVADITREPARPEESGEGWDDRPPSRFGRWALRVWLPLLDCETRDELQ
ncbi:MAG: exodeoxyribonuclease V subunit gamma [Solirubrobacteraceae bacterium]|nr:exodeoxyribonuclease V subunit gamma [Solirubrobacteraceae bacterium]